MAKVIDIGYSEEYVGQQILDIREEQYGYVASDIDYGRARYLANRNWTLTLIGVKQRKLEIEFEQFDLAKKKQEECSDYLWITTLKEFCKMKSANQEIYSLPSDYISFNFFTDNSGQADGFWLQYKGNACFYMPSIVFFF